MKTLYPKIIYMLLFIFVSAYAYPAEAKKNMGHKTISGFVYDKQSKKGIGYATLLAKKTNISTVANEEGFFSLKINDSVDVTQVEVSSVGYNSQLIDISDEAQQDVKIFLSPNIRQLEEVLIIGGDALEIVKEAIEKIEENNCAETNLLTGFYRETAKKRNSYITIAEAVINMYKTPYSKDVQEDKVQVLKGRTLMSPKISDTIVVKVQGGPNIAKYLDLVKNRSLMLDPETIDFYKFTIEGMTTINDKLHYIVDFAPQVEASYPLYYGKLYIAKDNLTFSRAELNLNVDDKDKAAKAILIKKPSGMKFQINSLASTITYKESNGKSYLNYINNEIKFKCNWKKFFYAFAPTYTITSEVVITDRQENNVKKISHKDVFGEKQTLPDKIASFYDPYFWEAYNIIEPTESLESAVNKLMKSTK